MTTLAYWCRSCRAWWDAGVLGPQVQEIQHHQLHDTRPSGVWLKHPGQTECPSCSLHTTQDLPTAFVGRKAGALIEEMRDHGSSLILNWGEDTGVWEVAWITGGRRFCGFDSDLKSAMFHALNAARVHYNIPLLTWAALVAQLDRTQ